MRAAGVLEVFQEQSRNGAMQTQFRQAVIPAEIRTLVAFDRKVFQPSDWFEREDWRAYESWWMIVDKKKVGCCAFESNVDFQEDVRKKPPRRGSLYVASTGILPKYRRLGFGKVLKSWQISYARYHQFTRIVTNTRESNKIMIDLNRKFGFKVLRITSGYYEDPCEPSVVMELSLGES
jgi:ribosomal protein S18 acetylase RimI-like enzyme